MIIRMTGKIVPVLDGLSKWGDEYKQYVAAKGYSE